VTHSRLQVFLTPVCNLPDFSLVLKTLQDHPCPPRRVTHPEECCLPPVSPLSLALALSIHNEHRLTRLSSSSCRANATRSVIFSQTRPNTVTLSIIRYVLFLSASAASLHIPDIFTSVSTSFTLCPSLFRALVLMRFSAWWRR